jgi:hypothetical protein
MKLRADVADHFRQHGFTVRVHPSGALNWDERVSSPAIPVVLIHRAATCGKSGPIQRLTAPGRTLQDGIVMMLSQRSKDWLKSVIILFQRVAHIYPVDPQKAGHLIQLATEARQQAKANTLKVLQVARAELKGAKRVQAQARRRRRSRPGRRAFGFLNWARRGYNSQPATAH